MQTLPYRGLERASSGRNENLVGVGQLVDPEPIERIVELNVPSAPTRMAFSHVERHRETQ